MAIISSLAAWLLLLISSFSLAENRKSFSASDSIWMEIETEKSVALSTAAVSNITTTLKPEDENLLREKAVHNMRTGVYTTEVVCGIDLTMLVNCHPGPNFLTIRWWWSSPSIYNICPHHITAGGGGFGDAPHRHNISCSNMSSALL